MGENAALVAFLVPAGGLLLLMVTALLRGRRTPAPKPSGPTRFVPHRFLLLSFGVAAGVTSLVLLLRCLR